MQRWLMTAVAAGLLVAGVRCPAGLTDDYYPLSVGSTWNSEGYVLFGTTAAALDTWQTHTGLSKVERQTQLTGGGNVFEVSYQTTIHARFPSETTFTVLDTSYVRETGSAVLSYQTLGDTEPDTVMVLPLAAGKTWRVDSSTTVEVIGQEDVAVKAGSFQQAWKLKMATTTGGTTVEMFFWYANRVGQVKGHWEFVPMAGYLQVYHNELTGYTIK